MNESHKELLRQVQELLQASERRMTARYGRSDRAIDSCLTLGETASSSSSSTSAGSDVCCVAEVPAPASFNPDASLVVAFGAEDLATPAPTRCSMEGPSRDTTELRSASAPATAPTTPTATVDTHGHPRPPTVPTVLVASLPLAPTEYVLDTNSVHVAVVPLAVPDVFPAVSAPAAPTVQLQQLYNDNGDDTRPLPWPSFQEIDGCESPSDAVMKPSRQYRLGNLFTSTDCIIINDMCSSSELRCLDVVLLFLKYWSSASNCVQSAHTYHATFVWLPCTISGFQLLVMVRSLELKLLSSGSTPVTLLKVLLNSGKCAVSICEYLGVDITDWVGSWLFLGCSVAVCQESVQSSSDYFIARETVSGKSLILNPMRRSYSSYDQFSSALLDTSIGSGSCVTGTFIQDSETCSVLSWWSSCYAPVLIENFLEDDNILKCKERMQCLFGEIRVETAVWLNDRVCCSMRVLNQLSWCALNPWSPLLLMVYTYWLLLEHVSVGVDVLDVQLLMWINIVIFSGCNTPLPESVNTGLKQLALDGIIIFLQDGHVDITKCNNRTCFSYRILVRLAVANHLAVYSNGPAFLQLDLGPNTTEYSDCKDSMMAVNNRAISIHVKEFLNSGAALSSESIVVDTTDCVGSLLSAISSAAGYPEFAVQSPIHYSISIGWMLFARIQSGQNESHILLLPWVLEQEELILEFQFQQSSTMPDWCLRNQSITATGRLYYSLKYKNLAATWRSMFLCVRFLVQLEATCSVQTNWLLTHVCQLTSEPSEESCCCALISLSLHITIQVAYLLQWSTRALVDSESRVYVGVEPVCAAFHAFALLECHPGGIFQSDHGPRCGQRLSSTAACWCALSFHGKKLQDGYVYENLQFAYSASDQGALLFLIQSTALKYVELRWFTSAGLLEILSTCTTGFSRQLYANYSVQSNSQLTDEYPPSVFGPELWIQLDYKDCRATRCALLVANSTMLIFMVVYCGGQETFQGGRHTASLHRHMMLRLPWDPGKLLQAQAFCDSGSELPLQFKQVPTGYKYYLDDAFASYHLSAFFDVVSVRHDMYFHLVAFYPNSGSYYDSSNIKDHRLQWVQAGSKLSRLGDKPSFKEGGVLGTPISTWASIGLSSQA